MISSVRQPLLDGKSPLMDEIERSSTAAFLDPPAPRTKRQVLGMTAEAAGVEIRHQDLIQVAAMLTGSFGEVRGAAYRVCHVAKCWNEGVSVGLADAVLRTPALVA